MSVVIVGESNTNLTVLGGMLARMGVSATQTFTNPVAALDQLPDLAPTLVIVDYEMSQLDGIAFTGQVRALPRLGRVPIMMLAHVERRDVRLMALEAGVTDFVKRPVDPPEFRARVRNLLTLGEAQALLRQTASWLAREVQAATATLLAREEEIVFRLSRAAEFRDADTGGHVARMAKFSRLIAEALGMDEAACRNLYLAAPMHDVGKIGVPDAVLLKEGPLDEDEQALLRQHVAFGESILSSSSSDLIQLAAEIARTHHERWDGCGYPHGLAGTEIPLSGRIVAVADVFDALISARPYKEAWPMLRAREYLAAKAGTHFDPACVDAFMSRWSNVLAVVRGDAETLDVVSLGAAA